MCRRVTCRTCDKASWAGCGAHVEQVMAGIPQDQRCSCTAEERATARNRGGSFWSRLFARG